MISALKQLLTTNSRERQHLNTPVHEEENPHFLTDREQINRVLSGLKNSRALISLVIPEVKEKFLTTLIEVQEEVIVFDQLKPEWGQSALLNSSRAKLMAKLRGVEVSFQIDSVVISRRSGGEVYRAAWPQRIYYPQRRVTHRLNMNGEKPVSFHGLLAQSAAPVNGHVYDLSVRGVSIIMNKPISARTGDMVKSCHIDLPDGPDLHFDLSLRYVKMINPRVTYIGGCYSMLDRKVQKALARYIMTVERESVKKHKVLFE